MYSSSRSKAISIDSWSFRFNGSLCEEEGMRLACLFYINCTISSFSKDFNLNFSSSKRFLFISDSKACLRSFKFSIIMNSMSQVNAE